MHSDVKAAAAALATNCKPMNDLKVQVTQCSPDEMNTFFVEGASLTLDLLLNKQLAASSGLGSAASLGSLNHHHISPSSLANCHYNPQPPNANAFPSMLIPAPISIQNSLNNINNPLTTNSLIAQQHLLTSGTAANNLNGCGNLVTSPIVAPGGHAMDCSGYQTIDHGSSSTATLMAMGGVLCPTAFATSTPPSSPQQNGTLTTTTTTAGASTAVVPPGSIGTRVSSYSFASLFSKYLFHLLSSLSFIDWNYFLIFSLSSPSSDLPI